MVENPNFAPFEIEIVEEHAEEAGFLWSLRESASGDPRYRLDELCRVDERLEARLDALLLAESTGWDVARSALDLAEEEAVFVASVVSIERADLEGFARVLDAVERVPRCLSGVAGALAWVPFESIAGLVPGLLAREGPAELRYLGVCGAASHRRDPGQALSSGIGSDDARLRARSLLAAGELGRLDLRGAVRDALLDADPACRFAAGFAGVLLGEPESTRALMETAAHGGEFAEPACAMAVRRMSVGAARAWLSGLAASPATARAALCGTGAVGDVEAVPSLLERMRDPALARLAGAAFAAITGADFASEKLVGSAPEGFSGGPTDDPDDEDVAMDPDGSSPWPDVEAVRAWWGKKRGSFDGSRRHVLGKPLSPEWLEEVLRSGHQPAREAAAVELCLAGRRKVLVPVRARGDRQRRVLFAAKVTGG